MNPMTTKMQHKSRGEKLKIKPEEATPFLKPSSNKYAMAKPTIAKMEACVKIKRVINLLLAPMAFNVP